MFSMKRSNLINSYKKEELYSLINNFVKVINSHKKIQESESSNFIKRKFYNWYYGKFKLGLLFLKITRRNNKIYNTISKNPTNLMYYITQYCVWFLWFCELFEVQKDEVIHNIFGDKVNIDFRYGIKGNSDKITDIIILSNNCRFFNLDDERYTKIKVHLDTGGRDSYIEEIKYKCYDALYTSTAPVDSFTHLKIDNKGFIINPNYQYSKELAQNEYKSFTEIAMNIIEIFISLYNICIGSNIIIDDDSMV